MFSALCLQQLLAERYVVGLIERLRASARLREICGFADAVPSDSTFSRFFSRLASIPALAEIAAMQTVELIRLRLPDVGADVSVDSTDIQAHAHPDRSETDATWGFRTTKPQSGAKKDKEVFFGYKMHAIYDAVHGLPLAHIILPDHMNDSPQLVKLVDKARRMYPLSSCIISQDLFLNLSDAWNSVGIRGLTGIVHKGKSRSSPSIERVTQLSDRESYTISA